MDDLRCESTIQVLGVIPQGFLSFITPSQKIVKCLNLDTGGFEPIHDPDIRNLDLGLFEACEPLPKIITLWWYPSVDYITPSKIPDPIGEIDPAQTRIDHGVYKYDVSGIYPHHPEPGPGPAPKFTDILISEAMAKTLGVAIIIMPEIQILSRSMGVVKTTRKAMLTLCLDGVSRDVFWYAMAFIVPDGYILGGANMLLGTDFVDAYVKFGGNPRECVSMGVSVEIIRQKFE